jgi:hypothetical protein
MNGYLGSRRLSARIVIPLVGEGCRDVTALGSARRSNAPSPPPIRHPHIYAIGLADRAHHAPAWLAAGTPRAPPVNYPGIRQTPFFRRFSTRRSTHRTRQAQQRSKDKSREHRPTRNLLIPMLALRSRSAPLWSKDRPARSRQLLQACIFRLVFESLFSSYFARLGYLPDQRVNQNASIGICGRNLYRFSLVYICEAHSE